MYVSKVVDTKNLSKNQLAGLIGKLNLEEEQEEKLLGKALALKEGWWILYFYIRVAVQAVLSVVSFCFWITPPKAIIGSGLIEDGYFSSIVS